MSNIVARPTLGERARRNHDALGGCEARVLAQLLPFIGYPRMLDALRVLNRATAPASSDA
jgi:hypothetical protein